MLKDKENSSRKLYPLRKFSLPGIYSVAYLSQLVQRNKLKAKKIGRNYFTTKEWFNEYLERHARDEKQHDYYDYLNKNKLKLSGLAAGKLNIKKKLLSSRLIAITAAFFIMLFIGAWYISINFHDKGQVAGESEAYQVDNITASSSSILNNAKIKNQNAK